MFYLKRILNCCHDPTTFASIAYRAIYHGTVAHHIGISTLVCGQCIVSSIPSHCGLGSCRRKELEFPGLSPKWQAVSLYPQRLETAAPGVAGNRSFCLLGQRPKPFEPHLRCGATHSVPECRCPRLRRERRDLRPLESQRAAVSRPCRKTKNGAEQHS